MKHFWPIKKHRPNKALASKCLDTKNISSEKGYAIYRGKWFAFDQEGFDNLEQALEEGGVISREASKNIVSYRQYLKFKKFLIKPEIPFSDSFSQDDFLSQLFSIDQTSFQKITLTKI